MTKFNTTTTNKTTNKSGNPAYKMKDKEKLVTQVLSSFFNESKYYGDNSADMEKTIERVVKKDPQFIANLAVYARREFHMRSVSHVLVAYLAHAVEGKPYTRKAVKAVSLRGDDVTEIMSFYLNKFGKPVPNALKKGIADVLQGFDEFTLAKYKGNSKQVKMRDLFCLCRPKPANKEQSDLWKRVLEQNLRTPMTWETVLSVKGNNKESWEKLIEKNAIGYMAALRNLRNILKAQPSNLNKIIDKIQDPEAVKKSKQLPFRYLSAYKEVKDMCSTNVYNALEKAVNLACENVPRLDGTTVIAVDVSGSMDCEISKKSDVTCGEIAVMLGLIANKVCENSYFYIFDTDTHNAPWTKNAPVLETVTHLRRYLGGGTDMSSPFERMIKDNIKADRVIILSDNECNRGRKPVQRIANKYRKHSGQDIWVHAIDLQGYGTQQFTGKKTNVIAGWSEKVFDFIRLAEAGEGNLIKTIESYKY